jgi:hypothetical protein
MPNPVIKGDSTILWGADGVYTASGCGFVTTGSKELTGEKVEIKDKNGFTVSVIFFDDKKNVSFEAVIATAAPALVRGDAATICGIAYCLIDGVEELWANNDARKYRVRATNYIGITAPP